MRHHACLLKEFSIELDTEHAKFLNTCENLLQDVVMISPAELTELLQQGSEKWRLPDLQSRLESRLRLHSAKQFVLSVEAMDKILGELKERFPITGDEGKVKILTCCHAFSYLLFLEKKKKREESRQKYRLGHT